MFVLPHQGNTSYFGSAVIEGGRMSTVKISGGESIISNENISFFFLIHQWLSKKLLKSIENSIVDWRFALSRFVQKQISQRN